MTGRNYDPEKYSRSIRKIIEEIVVVSMLALLGWHGVHTVYSALFPVPTGETKKLALLRGFVRTSDDLPVRKAKVYLSPEARPDAEVAIGVNDAGYFEGACPESGTYRLRVLVNGQATGTRTLSIHGCADKLYEIRVQRELSADNVEVALAAR